MSCSQSSGFDPDKRVSELSDSEIAAICADVEREVDVQCGTHPETGEPRIIEETPGRRDCIAALEETRDGDYGCRVAGDVADCWAMPPCERFYGAGCDDRCPEYEACWTYSLSECESEGGDWCYVVEGQKWNATDECYSQRPAYCAPSDQGCSAAFTTTLDADGSCWLMNSICSVPDGWENETDGRSCPYEPSGLECP